MAKLKQVKTSDLIPYANNARTHSEHQIAQIAASIREFGFTNPVLIDEDNGIIAGHGRVQGARLLKMDKIPCITLSGLTKAQKRAYVITDNKLAMNAGWDDELLALEITGLKDEDFDIDLLGFNTDELDALLSLNDGTEGLTDPDAVPEAPETPISVLGDIWILGNHRLMCGDSTDMETVEKLMNRQKADMVFTDPPYGVNYDGGHAVRGKRRNKLENDGAADIYGEALPVIYALTKDGAAMYLWFSDSKSLAVLSAVLSVGYEVRNTLIWNKNVAQFGAIGAQYKSKHEPCLYCFKKGNPPFWAGVNNEVSVWDINRANKNEFHPTQKPVELVERALNNSSKGGDLIIDLFGGSGSTLVACEKTNRNCRMMELDPRYIDVIINRWQDFTGQSAILESTGKEYKEVA